MDIYNNLERTSLISLLQSLTEIEKERNKMGARQKELDDLEAMICEEIDRRFPGTFNTPYSRRKTK